MQPVEFRYVYQSLCQGSCYCYIHNCQQILRYAKVFLLLLLSSYLFGSFNFARSFPLSSTNITHIYLYPDIQEVNLLLERYTYFVHLCTCVIIIIIIFSIYFFLLCCFLKTNEMHVQVKGGRKSFGNNTDLAKVMFLLKSKCS